MNLILELTLCLMIFGQLSRWLLAELFIKRHTLPRLKNSHFQKKTISILQPILSGDPLLERCLEANINSVSDCKREWLWLVDRDDLAAQKICKKLQKRHTAHTILVILCPPAAPLHNPKTHKLAIGARRAQGQYLAVLDDDTVLPDFGLDQSLRYFNQSSCGLVFGIPYYQYHGTAWSALIAGFVNANSLLTYLPYLSLSSPLTINGMYYLLKASTVKKLGYFESLKKFVCDDVAVAQAVKKIGLTLQQSAVFHPVSTHLATVTAFNRLVLRWFTFPRISLLPGFSLKEFFIFGFLTMAPVFFGLISLLILALENSSWPWVLAYWLVLLAIYLRISLAHLQSAGKVVWMVLSNLIFPWYTVVSFFQPPHVTWRGKKISFHGNTIVS